MDRGLTSRMTRAAKLDVSLYEEVEADANATAQALVVVVLSSLAAGIGAAGKVTNFGPFGLVVATLAALVGWVVWALLTYFIGTRILPSSETKADMGELLRTTGFSSAPGIIRVLGIIPFLGWLAMVVAAVWMLISMVIAVRQALDYQSTGRAIAVCFLGWIFSLLLALIVGGVPLGRPGL
jgi:hypothetical protein